MNQETDRVHQSTKSTGRRRWFTGYRLIWIIAPLLVIAGLVAWWFLSQYVFFNFHVIIPDQAYRSAQPSPAFLRQVVAEDHIKSIIKFNRRVESSWSRQEIPLAKQLGVKMFYVPVGVSELPGRKDLINIVNAIDNAPRPVLIHCKTGADRTGLAAVLVAWRNGQSYEEAKSSQLGLRFMHVGHLGADIDDVLEQYEQDMAAEHKPIGDYAQFRQYVLNDYYPSFYHAGIYPEKSTLAGRPGQTVVFDVKVTNLTRHPWEAGWFSTFRLNLGIPGTGQGNYPDLLAQTDIGSYLAPGQSLMVHLPVQIPDVDPGLHPYVLDIGQKHGLTFAHYGSPTVNVYIDVR